MANQEATRGRIHKISVSVKTGTKKTNVGQAQLVTDHGIEGDAHAGTNRQVSLLAWESFDKINSDLLTVQPGEFAENITTVGISLADVTIGQRLLIGDNVELMITQIGKKCHHGCYIREIVGDCIMPREGVFARVIRGGPIRVGDSIGMRQNAL